MEYRTRRKVLVINIAGVMGGVSSILFAYINYRHGLFTLMYINMITFIAGFALPIFHSRGYYSYPQLVVGLIYSISCAVSAMMYNNNMEFYLLLFMGVYFALVDDYRVLVPFSLINISLFLFIHTHPNYISGYSQVSGLHRFVVLLNGVLLFLFFLYYMKRLTLNYQYQIEKQNEALTVLNDNKEKLFAIMSHDIRGPITSAGTVLQMLNEKLLSREEFEEMSIKLSEQMDNVRQNIDTLLIWSQSQLNGITVIPRTINLKEVMKKVIEGIEVALLSKSIVLRISGNDNFEVYSDPNHLELVLRNLISNAIKFSYADSQIELKVNKRFGVAELSIKDQGIGLSAERQMQIFDNQGFFSSYGTNNEKGTGLGLKLCREFVEKNGGRIWVESKVGEGSAFSFTIPLHANLATA